MGQTFQRRRTTTSSPRRWKVEMGLPPSFANAAQAARQVLSDFDVERFRETLERTPVGVTWDEVAATTTEGRATLDLAVDLLARLYPEVRLKALDSRGE